MRYRKRREVWFFTDVIHEIPIHATSERLLAVVRIFEAIADVLGSGFVYERKNSGSRYLNIAHLRLFRNSAIVLEW